MKTTDMERLNPLALSAYSVAVALMLIPLADVLVPILPLHPGTVSWRYGALGLGSQAIISPLLGVLLAFVTATLLEHQRGLRILQILAWVAAACLLVASVLFVLDALQTRATVRGAAKDAFDRGTAEALAKYIVGVVISVTFAITGQRLIRRMRTHEASASEAPTLVRSSRGDS